MPQLAASGTKTNEFTFWTFLNYTGADGKPHPNEVFIVQGQRNVKAAITNAMAHITTGPDGKNTARVEFDTTLNTHEQAHVVVELKIVHPIGENHNLAPIGFFSWLVTGKDSGQVLMNSNGFVPGPLGGGWVVFVTP